MPNDDTIEYRLSLHNVEELFAEPAADPWDPASRYVSGIDEAVNYFHQQNIRDHPLRLVISLQEQTIDAALIQRTREALQRYCDFQIVDNQRQIRDMEIEGNRTLITSIPILAVIVIIGLLAYMIPGLPQALLYFIATTLGVFAWVALWNPADYYIYEWRPFRRYRIIFEKLRDGELIIQPAT
jgi:hypothetical protein